MNDNLPTDSGYVVAAYLVFLLLLLIYFGIMALRLSRLERELSELGEHPPAGQGSLGAGAPDEPLAEPSVSGERTS
jgi:hypothetical protein